MVSNYDLTILKNKLDLGFAEMEEDAIDTYHNIDWIYRRMYRYSRNTYISYDWETIEYKIKFAFNEIKDYNYAKHDIYVNCINPIIIDLLVLWKNSKTQKHKLNLIEDEKETTSNKLPRRN